MPVRDWGDCFLRRALIVFAAVLLFTNPVWESAAIAADRPVALVESVEGAPGAGVEFLDYVYPGQTIELGPDGVVVLFYLSSCSVETVKGGRLTIENGAGKVEDGTIDVKKVPCRGANIVVSKDSGEAGATVDRVTPFTSQDWSEWTVKSPTPVFKWDRQARATVTLVDLDSETKQPVWTAAIEGSHVAYPADAPPLRIGIPYEVRVAIPGAGPYRAAFSFDPDLDGPDTLSSSVIPLTQPASKPESGSEEKTEGN